MSWPAWPDAAFSGGYLQYAPGAQAHIPVDYRAPVEAVEKVTPFRGCFPVCLRCPGGNGSGARHGRA